MTKGFNGKAVLDGIDLSIYENQITTIIGKSGTGKSVLLKHIIGLLKPDSGTVLFEGQPVNRMKRGEWDRYRSRISYMFQNNALFDSMTVFDNVALPLRQTTRLGSTAIREKVMARLDQTDLADAAGKYPSERSGGMQKHVALARAPITDPKVILFDEPTTGQDPIRRNVILSMIAEYRRKLGFTAVLISHDIPDVYFISDRIILLWEGKVGFQGSYQELTEFDHPMIKEFLDSIEGLQDGLTGLLSKQVFRSRYLMSQDRGKPNRNLIGILFAVEFDLLSDTLVPAVAAEVNLCICCNCGGCVVFLRDSIAFGSRVCRSARKRRIKTRPEAVSTKLSMPKPSSATLPAASAAHTPSRPRPRSSGRSGTRGADRDRAAAPDERPRVPRWT